MTSLENTNPKLRIGTRAWMQQHTEAERQVLAWRRLHSLIPHDVLVKYAKPTDPSTDLAALARNLEDLV